MSRDHWFGKSQWSFPTREVYESLQQAARNDAFRKDYDELRKDYDEVRKDYDELRGYFDNSHNYTDIWHIEKPTLHTEHPTIKPLEICERAFISTSQEGAAIFDPFAGSGTTLIACEKLGRIGYAMEIEPRYCDVTIKRWEDYTGRKAELLEHHR